jgi:hypothetical protein
VNFEVRGGGLPAVAGKGKQMRTGGSKDEDDVMRRRMRERDAAVAWHSLLPERISNAHCW